MRDDSLKLLFVFVILLGVATAAKGEIPQLNQLSTFGFWAAVLAALGIAALATSWFSFAGKPLLLVAGCLGALSFFGEAMPGNFRKQEENARRYAEMLEFSTSQDYRRLPPHLQREVDEYLVTCAIFNQPPSSINRALYDAVQVSPYAQLLPPAAGQMFGALMTYSKRQVDLDCK